MLHRAIEYTKTYMDQQNPGSSDPVLTTSAQPSDAQSIKQLTSEAAVKIEAANAATATNPRRRAAEIYRIKAEYLKMRYNVELKLPDETQQI